VLGHALFATIRIGVSERLLKFDPFATAPRFGLTTGADNIALPRKSITRFKDVAPGRNRV
jgi:hypothetical protein